MLRLFYCNLSVRAAAARVLDARRPATLRKARYPPSRCKNISLERFIFRLRCNIGDNPRFCNLCRHFPFFRETARYYTSITRETNIELAER